MKNNKNDFINFVKSNISEEDRQSINMRKNISPKIFELMKLKNKDIFELSASEIVNSIYGLNGKKIEKGDVYVSSGYMCGLFGIKLESFDDKDVKGGIFIDSNNQAVIRYNKEMSADKRRETRFHELGHFIAHISTGKLKSAASRDGNYSKDEQKYEDQANKISRELLEFSANK